MPEAQHILVVDDEPQITRVLRTMLATRRYDIRIAADGEAALQVLKDWTPDLVITDLAMPNMDGIELCRRIRKTSAAPIIVLSVRNQPQTKIKALNAGADDYVTKPFDMGELLARVRAHLRRAPTPSAEQVIEVGDFRIDLTGHTVSVRGREVQLTPKEFDLLVHLAGRPHKVVTHESLLESVWGADRTEQLEYLRVFVASCARNWSQAAASLITLLPNHGWAIASNPVIEPEE